MILLLPLLLLLLQVLLQPFYGSLDVARDYPGEMIPERQIQNQSGFPGAKDSEWQWDQLGHMQICTSPQIDNHASTSPLSFLQAGCPSCHPTTASKH